MFKPASKGEAGNTSTLYKFASSGLSAPANRTYTRFFISVMILNNPDSVVQKYCFFEPDHIEAT